MDVALIGLGVMGKNLVLNLLEHKYKVSIYNRTSSKTTNFVKEIESDMVKGCYSLSELVNSLKSPRIIMILIQSGPPVDMALENLKVLLKPEDVVIDLGNSNYLHTECRMKLYENDFLFVGCGISGGEEGARYGASLMPGGNARAWPLIKNVLESLAASYADFKCCDWIGDGESGHFVKMVHNGIEYGNMAIFAESYDVLRFGKSDVKKILTFWQEKTFLSSYLLEIYIKIVEKVDLTTIEDIAENKGTGLWCIKSAMDCQCNVNVICDAVHARMMSNEKEKRLKFSKNIKIKKLDNTGILNADCLTDAVSLSFAVSYLQGLQLIKKMSDKKNWALDLKKICKIWMNGCIIRSKFLVLAERMLDDFENSLDFIKIYEEKIKGLRETCLYAIKNELPCPALNGVLMLLDGLKMERGNGAMIQAMRDYFGKHGVRFVGDKEDSHIDWSSKD